MLDPENLHSRFFEIFVAAQRSLAAAFLFSLFFGIYVLQPKMSWKKGE